MMKILKGFTLAEILITLGVIGVVSAMTLPVLIHKYRSMVLKNQFKKSYSMLNKLSVGVRDEFGDCKTSLKEDIKLYINNNIKYVRKSLPSDYKQYTIIGQDANTNLHMNCLKNNIGTVWGTQYRGVTTDGSYIALCSHNGVDYGDLVGNYISIDINGNKKPNKFGHDIFFFHLDGRTCKPTGAITYRNFKPDETGYGIGSNAHLAGKCDFTDTTDHNGFGCTNYAIQDKCPDGSNRSYFECLPR